MKNQVQMILKKIMFVKGKENLLNQTVSKQINKMSHTCYLNQSLPVESQIRMKLEVINDQVHGSQIPIKEAANRLKADVKSETVVMAADPDFIGDEAGATTFADMLDGEGPLTSGMGAEAELGA
ncbi:unnamed protein product [Rhodiola kirilowii]